MARGRRATSGVRGGEAGEVVGVFGGMGLAKKKNGMSNEARDLGGRGKNAPSPPSYSDIQGPTQQNSWKWTSHS